MFYRVCIFIIVAVITCFGCEESGVEWVPCEVMDSEYDVRQLYIGSNCNDLDWGIMYEAVDRLNEMSRSLICGDIVEIVGEKAVDDTEAKYNDAASCFYYEPDWYDGSRYDGKAGWAGYSEAGRYMYLFRFLSPLATNDCRLNISMHELVHYAGVSGHIDGDDNVMSPYVNSNNTEYTRADAKHFCSVFNCVEKK